MGLFGSTKPQPISVNPMFGGGGATGIFGQAMPGPGEGIGAQSPKEHPDWSRILAGVSQGLLQLGSLGDMKSSAYENQVEQQKQRAELLQRQALAQAQDQQWYQHRDYQNAHQPPAPPSPEQRLVEWANSLQGPDRQKALETLDQFRPKVVGDPLMGYQPMARPGSGVQFGQGGDVPQVSDEAGYAAIPPGGHYKDPEGHIRTKGGQTQRASGGFPGY